MENEKNGERKNGKYEKNGKMEKTEKELRGKLSNLRNQVLIGHPGIDKIH